MSRLTIVASAALLVFSFGCAEDGEPDDPYSLKFNTGAFTVPQGDSFECFYTNVITDRELAVKGATAFQDVGGHHITVYYTTLIQDPNHHQCDDAEMTDWHMLWGTGDSTNVESDGLRLPDGLGVKVPAGVQLVTQSHYINLTGAEFDANDEVTLEIAEPDELEAFANTFVIHDPSFTVPPGEALTKTSTCEVLETVKLVNLLGHMHEWGKAYSLEKVDAQGNVIEMLYEQTEWYEEFASNPPILHYTKNEPLVLERGTLLRQTCTWWNTEDYELIFPREMCVGFGLYYPDVGEQFCEIITE